MDKQSKVIIVALIVIGVVFALGLGTNLLHEDDKKDQEKQQEEYRKGFVGSMDNLLGRFSPALDVRRLKDPQDTPTAAKCNREGNAITFTSNAECMLEVKSIKTLSPKCDDDYQSTTLKLAKGDTTTRDALAQLRMKTTILTQSQKIFQAQKPVGTFGPQLEVNYRPHGKPAETVNLQGDKETRLVVLDAGGIFTLSCTGCSENRPVKLILKTRDSCS